MPDVGRGPAFAVTFVMCAFQVIAKAGATALLVVTNGTWLLGYVVADHALFFAYKVARNDAVVCVRRNTGHAARADPSSALARAGTCPLPPPRPTRWPPSSVCS